jgi:uncharacterized damage-inducible protein DinB
MPPELAHYLHRIDDLRGQVRELIADLPAEALNWRPLPTTADHAMNSLAVLAAHVAGAEQFWIAEVIGGLPPTRDREAEFATVVASSAPLVARLDAVGAMTHQVCERLSAADLEGSRQAHGREVSVRWAFLHVIDHTALHLGHMQITYQLWQGGVAKASPRWFQRLPRAS